MWRYRRVVDFSMFWRRAMAITVELRKGDAEGARSAMRSHVTDTALRAGFEIG